MPSGGTARLRCYLEFLEQESEELPLSFQFKSLLEPFVPKIAKVLGEPLTG